MGKLNYSRRAVFDYFRWLATNETALERAVAQGEIGTIAKAAYSLQPDDYSRRRFLGTVGAALFSTYCSGSKGSIDPCTTLIPGAPTPRECEPQPPQNRGNIARGPPLVSLLNDNERYTSGKISLGGKDGYLTEDGWEVKEIPTIGVHKGDFTGSGFAPSRFSFNLKQGMNEYDASRVLPSKIDVDFDPKVFRLMMCQNHIIGAGDTEGTATWDKNRMPDTEVYLDTFKGGRVLSEKFYRDNFRSDIINSARITLAPLITGSELPNYEIQERRGPTPPLPQESKVIIEGDQDQSVIKDNAVAAADAYIDANNRVYSAKITLTSNAGSGNINHEFANVAALSDFNLPFPPSTVNDGNRHSIGLSDYDRMYALARDLLPRKTRVTNGFIDVSHLGLEAVVNQIIREAGEIHGISQPQVEPQNQDNQDKPDIKHKLSDKHFDDEGFESYEDFKRHQELTRDLMRRKLQ